LTPDTNTGFDDAGCPVRVVDFDYAAVDREEAAQASPGRMADAIRVLDFLLREGGSPERAGRIAYILAYLVQSPSAPRTIRELAVHLHVSPTRTHQHLNKIREKLAELRAD
jgi:hypothetical protein